MLKFLGFLIFFVVATAAFFVIFALSVGAPFAFKPEAKKVEKLDEDNTSEKE